MSLRRRPDGLAVLVAGSAGSGKTTWTMQQVGDARRLLVWDAVGEWARKGYGTDCRTLDSVQRFILADVEKPTDHRICYTGPVTREHFAAWCRLAWVFLRNAPSSVLVVEELADVTSPGKAPACWGEIVRKHRHTGGRVYGLTQRPQESDKTLAGNAGVLHTGFLAFAPDRAYMARYLDVGLDMVTNLQRLEYLERDMRTRDFRAGKVNPRARTA